jgi:hypothetical protein
MSTLVAPETLAAYGLLIGTQMFAASVTHQGLVQYVQRSWTPSTAVRPMALRILAAMRAPTLTLAVGLALLVPIIAGATGLHIGLTWWLWMLGINLLTAIAHVTHAALQSEQRFWAHFWMSAIGSVARTFLPLALALLIAPQVGALSIGFLGYTAVWVAAGALLLSRGWTRRSVEPNAALLPPEALFASFAGAGLLGWLAATSVRWFAGFGLSPSETGYFILALNLSSIIPAAVSLIGIGYTFPALFSAARAGASDAELWRFTWRSAAVALIVGQLLLLALAAAAPHLVGTLIASRYAASLSWLLATGGTGLAAISAGFFSNLLLARERPRDCFRLIAVSALFRLAVMAALVATPIAVFRIGLAWLAWPTVLVEGATTLWLRRRQLRESRDLGAPAAATSRIDSP